VNATRRRAGLRLVPVAVAAWSVAGAGVIAPGTATWLALCLWAGAAAAVVVVVTRSRRGVGRARLESPGRGRPGWGRGRGSGASWNATGALVVLALAAAATVASHVALAQPARTQAAALALGGGRAVDVRAVVVGKIEHDPHGSLRFDATASVIGAGPRAHGVAVDVVVRVRPDDVDAPARLDVGTTLWARGTVTASYPGERSVLTVWAARGVEIVSGPAGGAAVAADLRRGLVGAVAGLPGPGAGLVPGLAVGDTTAVHAELDTAMKESSLSHLTAVSGANCALVVGIAFGLAAALGGSRRARVLSGLGALLGFVVLVTPEPSVARAATMAAIAMTALLLGRVGAGTAILSLAVTLLLIVDPWLSHSFGFALSAAATAALLLLARPLSRGLSRVMPGPLALALAVPLAAQLACGPLLVLIAPAVPLYGVLANLLAGPAAPVATTLGLLACLSAPLPWLQHGLAALAWVPASWIAATATTVASLPADSLPWVEGWPGAILLAGVGAAIAVIVVRTRSGARPPLRMRAVSVALVATVAGAGLGAAALTTVAGRWTLPSSWAVLACDVGQGDAVLLRSGDAVALVDTGPEPEPLAACLSRAGIDRIDLLVLTHFDADHVGGADAVAGRVGTVLHGPPDESGDVLLRELASNGARLVPADAGLTGRLGAARWQVLWPRLPSAAFPAGNDASVVLDVREGGIPATLLLGDLSAAPQRAVEASGMLRPPYAIVKVAHHGSADQHAELYAAADPAAALVTVGVGNDYGHPRDEILATLARVGARVARTDDDGMVALWGSAEGVTMWRERGG
jgi:competence protein ComEC